MHINSIKLAKPTFCPCICHNMTQPSCMQCAQGTQGQPGIDVGALISSAAHQAPVVQVNSIVHFLLCHLHRFLCVLTSRHRHVGPVIECLQE